MVRTEKPSITATRHYLEYPIKGSLLPYTNLTDNWLVIVGCEFSVAGLDNLVHGTSFGVLEIVGRDQWSIFATTINGNTSTGASVYSITLPRRMLLPPNLQLSSPAAIVLNVQAIQCLDTSTIDGRDSLENALLVKL